MVAVNMQQQRHKNQRDSVIFTGKRLHTEALSEGIVRQTHSATKLSKDMPENYRLSER